MNRHPIKPAEVLLVDDDPGDQELARRALGDGKYRANLHIVSNGEDALRYLSNEGKFSDKLIYPKPDLILLDLNMPKMDGREVLEKIRDNPQTRHLAVIVLTTSSQESDVLKSYELGCQSYITKPVSIKELTRVLEELGDYWFQLVTLPPKTVS